ncbi:centromere protein K-like [Oscarella lobularis]|uniref:centromere protein K-like n=1 Tax=Oscarella lobularis TaxID=121494 RepID=UPI00331370DE
MVDTNALQSLKAEIEALKTECAAYETVDPIDESTLSPWKVGVWHESLAKAEAEVLKEQTHEALVFFTTPETIEPNVLAGLKRTNDDLAASSKALEECRSRAERRLAQLNERRSQFLEIKGQIDAKLDEARVVGATPSSAVSTRGNADKRKLKKQLERLSKQMDEVATEYFSSPQTQKKRKGQGTATLESFYGQSPSCTKSLTKIIEELSLLHVTRPHYPYRDATDAGYWPGYVTILVQCGIALFNPSNSREIKLIPFHKSL